MSKQPRNSHTQTQTFSDALSIRCHFDIRCLVISKPATHACSFDQPHITADSSSLSSRTYCACRSAAAGFFDTSAHVQKGVLEIIDSSAMTPFDGLHRTSYWHSARIFYPVSFPKITCIYLALCGSLPLEFHQNISCEETTVPRPIGDNCKYLKLVRNVRNPIFRISNYYTNFYFPRNCLFALMISDVDIVCLH